MRYGFHLVNFRNSEGSGITMDYLVIYITEKCFVGIIITESMYSLMSCIHCTSLFIGIYTFFVYFPWFKVKPLNVSVSTHLLVPQTCGSLCGGFNFVATILNFQFFNRDQIS